MTAALVGFKTQHLTVQHVYSDELVIRLSLAPLAEVLSSVPEPRDAYRRATAIVHFKVLDTAPPGPCESAPMISSQHTAGVVQVFKGTVPAVIHFEQETAGRCRDGLHWHEGLEQTYRVGDHYVIFLTGGGERFGRLAGPFLSFRVDGDRVRLNGFAGVNESITLEALKTLLEDLARRVRSGQQVRYRSACEILDRHTKSLGLGLELGGLAGEKFDGDLHALI